MKQLLLSALLAVPFFAVTSGAAPKTFVNPAGQTFTYVNNGAILAPVIDAVNFVNNGTFVAITVLPFETSSTVNFTNFGNMIGQPGFFFNNSPAVSGQRHASATFFNGNNGLVQTAPLTVAVDVFGRTVSSSLLRIWADDVVNRGTLQVDPAGNLEMFCENATLSHSIVAVQPISSTGNLVDNINNQFTPDAGLKDSYWAVSNLDLSLNPTVLVPANLWNGAVATAPTVPGNPGSAFAPGFSISFGTNVFATQSATTGGPDANTNDLGFIIADTGVLIIDYDFFTVPDTIDIFTNRSTIPFFSSGPTNNPLGPATLTLPYGPGVTNIVIIMNMLGNPNQGTAWQYTPTIISQSLSTNNVPAAWYDIATDTTTLNLTNFIGGTTNTVTFTGVLSNVVKGAIFAKVPPRFHFDISFSPSGTTSNFLTPQILLTLPLTNAASGTVQDNFLYFEDTLASHPGPRLMQNVIDLTFRPTNYIAWDRQNHAPGPIAGNPGLPEPRFFIDSGSTLIPTFTNEISIDTASNRVVGAGLFSGYGMIVDSLPSRPPVVGGGGVSNFLGSVRIHSENLDISNARLRGEGEIFLQATHLNSSVNALLDCENLRFDIGAPVGSSDLVIENLAADQVEGRIRGIVRGYSTVWSNTVPVIFTNNFIMGPNPTNAADTNLVVLRSPFTNNVSVSYHVFMLDASGLQDTFPVNVFTLLMHGTNIVVNDRTTIYESFLADCQSLTLNANMTFPGAMPVFANQQVPGAALQNWINTNAPTLSFFTNKAILTIPNEAHFGDDLPQPYSAFVNRGAISAASIQVSSDYIEADGRKANDDGFIFGSGGILSLEGQKIIFLGGNSQAGNFINLTTTDLTLSNHTMVAQGAINLTVSGNLSDLGTTNVLEAFDGINLLVKPASGDLLKTTVFSVAPRPTGNFVTHLWAADDRGPTAAGFQNNGAIGTLSLFSFSGNSVFEFAGTGTQNGLYVDVLDLSGLGLNFTNQLQIEDNLIIYFASVILPSGVTVPVGMSPEEFLDGQLNGHLHWVPSFAGPASSVSLDINGKNYNFNEALRNSMTIDSDGDGIVNGLDSTPFRAPYAGPSVATYTGLFYGTNGVQYLQSGAVSITTTKKGKYSGTLRTGTKKYSFSGKLDSTGADARNIPKSSLSIRLQAEQDHISGTVANGTNWTAELNGERTVYGKSNKTPFVGTYNVTFPGSGDTNNAQVPFASGTAKAKVNAAGKITFNGKLGDGTKMSQTASISQDGLWPMFVSLYKGKGQILSWQNLASPDDVGGDFSWIKQPGAKSYPAGFKVETNATGIKLQ